ncbi:MAG: AraC family transcriptional regulator [Flavobacterium psychrophilum]|nr:MAG: AraC family transcriptional regulator [Flavobacterium psychrophilum]
MKKVNILNLEQFHDHDTSEEFHANTLSNHLITRHKDIYLPHKHNFYLSVLFTKGTGIHEIDFRSYEVKPGALFFLNPGQTHHWELSPAADGYIFFHSQNFYDLHYTRNRLSSFPFYYSIHSNPCIYLNKVKLKTAVTFFEMILKEYQNNKTFANESLISLTDLVYNESSRAYMLQNPAILNNKDKYYVKFRSFEELIEGNFREYKLPSQYADMLNMTSKHLNRITQAVVGKTASDVILERIILEAKKEIILQKQGFAEIAYLLGYDDYAYFSRLFTKKTGTTPSEFLKRY